jgi:DNA-binding NarL/FixJ family response regulator
MATLNAFIVEDSPVIRENLVAALEELVPLRVVGYAEDEPNACRWLVSPPQACDLVIVDLFLRQGSGLNVLRDLQHRGHGATRIVLTNYATPDIRRQCERLGASRVFDKSAQIDELVAYCQALADRRAA